MRWTKLSERQKLREILKAQLDPLYFQQPHFLDIELYPKSQELVREFYNGDYRELVLVAGMRGGKTTLLSYFACYETFLALTSDLWYKYHLAPGSPVFGILASAKEEQAKDTIYAAVKARIERSPFFDQFEYQVRSNYILFPDQNFMIRVVCSSSATEVGRTSKFVCIDEMSRLEETVGRRSGLEVYRALSKSTMTFKQDGHRFIAGSPRHVSDMIMRLYQRGQTSPYVLAAKYTTWELNPHITFDDLKDEFERDPLGAWRDYGADPSAAIETYYRDKSIIQFSDRPNVLAMIAEGIRPVPEPFTYMLAGDPALRHDAFGLALAHKEEDRFIVDGVYRFVPDKEIDPDEVKDFVLRVLDIYPVTHVVFDTWSFVHVQKAIQMKGAKVVNHIVRKADHDRVKELFYRKKLDVPRDDALRYELENLIIKPSGKVDHPRGGSKDVADALANVIWALHEIKKERIVFGLVRCI